MLINETLKDRYRLYDQLALGGAATVFLARDALTGRMVVVKVIHPHLVEDRFIARFLREIKVLQQVTSPHVVKIYDYGLNHLQSDLPDPVSFIAMEYVEGLTVSAIIGGLGPFSENNTLALARQIALALSELHRLGIVHRDLKAQNIMITAQDVAKIIDFGIAKNLRAEITLTGQDIFAGTLAYASPEQLNDSSNVDIRSDLYTLGVVMAECLLGQVPPRNRLGQHIMVDAPPAVTIATEKTLRRQAATVYEVVSRLLAVDPQDRYQHPAALLEELDTLRPNSRLALAWDRLGPRSAAERESPAAKVGYVLLSERGDHTPLTQPEIVIGRTAPGDDTWAPDVDVELMALERARTVSRYHCRLVRNDDGHYSVVDMGSFNGTWVNGERLEPSAPRLLSDGDQLHLGGVEFVYRTADEAAAARTRRSTDIQRTD